MSKRPTPDDRNGQGCIGLGPFSQSQGHRNQSTDRRESRHQNRPEPYPARPDNGFLQFDPFFPEPVDVIDQNDRIAHHHPDHHDDPDE